MPLQRIPQEFVDELGAYLFGGFFRIKPYYHYCLIHLICLMKQIIVEMDILMKSTFLSNVIKHVIICSLSKVFTVWL